MSVLSLKGKMTIVVSFLMAGILTLMAFVAARFFEREFRGAIARHQFSLVTALADEIDSKLLAARDQVTAAATGVTPAIIADSRQAEHFLASQVALLETFDNGLYLFSVQGKLIAGTAIEPHMQGQDYSFRDYFGRTVRSGRAVISDAVISTQNHRHPIVMFTAPVIGPQGTVTAMLVGSLDLLGENFLGRMSDLRIGGGGYLYLFAPDGTILLHPERGRILQAKIPAGELLFARAAEGFAGHGETVSLQGAAVLSTVSKLSATDWILAADFPLAEAYAPIRQAKRFFFIGQCVLVGVTLVAVWFFMHRLMAPLAALTEHLRRISRGEPLRPVQIGGRDEIGTLALTFNRMLTELEQQQLALGEQKEFTESLLLSAAAPIFVLDRDHRVVVWNRACEELTGVTAAEVKGTDRHWKAFYDHPRPCLADFVIDGKRDGLEAYYLVVAPADLVKEGLQAEGWRTTYDGRLRYMTFSAAPIRDRRGNVVAAIETLEDMTERKEAEKRMESLALFDPLTKLPNRTLFRDRLAHALAEASRYRQPLALLYLDLDGFKAINDSAGHHAGDRALVEVATRFEACLRGSDTLARIGGDEFIITLSRVAGEEDAGLVAARILAAAAVPVTLEEGTFTIGASIGISLFPRDGGDADTLIRNADAAMYRSKSAGKNRFVFFNHHG